MAYHRNVQILSFAGLTIVDELFIYVNAKTLVVGGCGLREGLFYDYYGENYLGGKFYNR